MGHKNTEQNRHDLMASAYIFYITEGSPRVILHKHKKHHKYLQFGGHVEAHENPWAAVLREVCEESGFTPEQMKVLQPPYEHLGLSDMALPHPVGVLTYPPSKGVLYTDICYAFTVVEKPRLAILDNESTEIITLSQQEFERLEPHETFDNVRHIIRYVFEIALPQWHPRVVKNIKA